MRTNAVCCSEVSLMCTLGGRGEQPSYSPVLGGVRLLAVSQFLDCDQVDPQRVTQYASFGPCQRHSTKMRADAFVGVGRAGIATLFKASAILEDGYGMG